MPGALRDGAPDAWGRRVILHALTDARGRDVETGGSHRTHLPTGVGFESSGAIDFQAVQRAMSRARIRRASTGGQGRTDRRRRRRVACGARLGARTRHFDGWRAPKALIADGDTELLAKFSTSDDILPVVKAEAASIELARHVGLDVPAARLVRAAGRTRCSSSVSTVRVVVDVSRWCRL